MQNKASRGSGNNFELSSPIEGSVASGSAPIGDEISGEPHRDIVILEASQASSAQAVTIQGTQVMSTPTHKATNRTERKRTEKELAEE